MDRAARGTGPARRGRLRHAALRAAQARRHDHELHRVSPHTRAVRPAHPSADRWRVRIPRRSRARVSRAAGVGHGRRALRHRHLHDDDRGRTACARRAGVPRSEGARPQGPGGGPRPDVHAGRRHALPSRGGARNDLARGDRVACRARRRRSRAGRAGGERGAHVERDREESGLSVSLKEDQLILITEDDGSLPLRASSALGFYYHDTQFLSGYKVRVNGTEPLLLSANTEQNYVATFQLMHSEGATIGTARHSAKTLSIRRTRFLADGLRERIGILNANPQPAHITPALDALNARYRRFIRGCTSYETSSETLDEGLIARSALDLRALLEFHEGGPFPTAGIPWYAVPFGRDALITAYQTLGWNPDLARGTLRLLARYQGQKVDEYTEEEPGKIFHELRRGELARLGEIPHRPYYGAVDATPLFALVFAETVKWTADRALWRELLAAAERALTWCHGPYGDPDRDGYVEYGARGTALRSQGWKDSSESLSERDGSWSELPAALVEVQAYVFAAKRGLADLYALDGDHKRAERLRAEARELQEKFERDFWMADENAYAQALNAKKRQVPAVTSNAAHTLWAGIASPDRATALVRRLMSPDMYTGWGLRTLSSRYPTYNPMSYHNGSVWPHDSAMAAQGMARYGFHEEANEVVSGLIEAGRRFPNSRLPELFCGFQRDLRFSSRPADYLVSCIPQAWSAGMIFLNLRTLLGMEPDLLTQRLLMDPALPPWLERIDVRDLRVFGEPLSFRVRRRAGGDKIVGARGRVVRAGVASPA